MAIKSEIWTVGTAPQKLPESSVGAEALLEDMIVSSPEMISDSWMLIGRQEPTGAAGRIDLLAIAPDGGLVLIELKREKTPRDVVAQSIDYASWVADLGVEEIEAIYRRFTKDPARELVDDFRKRFGAELDIDSINESHQIIIVASALDAATERIVQYLSERDIAINVLTFQIFEHDGKKLLSRTWLIDPATAPTPPTVTKGGIKEPWNGEIYSSFGHGPRRSWEEARKYGFISGGGGQWYSNTLKSLKAGDRVWVNVPPTGYVGVCRVTAPAQTAATFTIATHLGDQPALEVLQLGDYHRLNASDDNLCEYFVAVTWLDSRQLGDAVKELGFFGNQNTVCKPVTPSWRTTVERLKTYFADWDKG